MLNFYCEIYRWYATCSRDAVHESFHSKSFKYLKVNHNESDWKVKRDNFSIVIA